MVLVNSALDKPLALSTLINFTISIHVLSLLVERVKSIAKPVAATRPKTQFYYLIFVF